MNELQKRLLEIAAQEKSGEMTNNELLMTFDGGETYEGWIHEIYIIHQGGTLEFSRWESGGYQDSENVEPYEVPIEQLIDRLQQGELPLPRWTNPDFIKRILPILDDFDIEKVRRRLRDFFNKTQNHSLIITTALANDIKIGNAE